MVFSTYAMNLPCKKDLEEGPDREWHLGISLMEAITTPSSQMFSEAGMRIVHYQDTSYAYDLSWDFLDKCLSMLQEGSQEDVFKWAKNEIESNTSTCISEKSKYHIAHGMFYEFLNGLRAYKTVYLEALKEKNCVRLAALAVLFKDEKLTKGSFIQYMNSRMGKN